MKIGKLKKLIWVMIMLEHQVYIHIRLYTKFQVILLEIERETMIRKSGEVNGHFVALGRSHEKYSNKVTYCLLHTTFPMPHFAMF